ncbi:hypothetical protein EDD16DRAFT_1733103 [Pisolithus croceorrhizus]|nr:hypothetical protein EDD16DRAFT_1733103 [Pisolithus croceorrhizus]
MIDVVGDLGAKNQDHLCWKVIHPELKFEEEKRGFVTQRHYLLETAWVATYTHGQGGPVLGVNSEMDLSLGLDMHVDTISLASQEWPSLALRRLRCRNWASMESHFAGTPGEEGGTLGKVKLWKREHTKGWTAHAGLSPWEGQNALDAAVLAYTSIGLLRQHTKPTHRIHGIFEGKDWAPNIIPDNSTMYWYVRAPTTKEMLETTERVKACFECVQILFSVECRPRYKFSRAAAIATGCNVVISEGSVGNELVQNPVLGAELADVVCKKYGMIDYEWGIASASTDFGNISYLMPGLHPGFSIPSVPNGGNHTPAFTEAASTMEAHEACLDVSKALAAVGMRVLIDKTFLSKASLVRYPDLFNGYSRYVGQVGIRGSQKRKKRLGGSSLATRMDATSWHTKKLV